LVQVTNMHPRPLPGGPVRALAAWCIALGLAALVGAGLLDQAWWWTQGLLIVGALLAMAQLGWMQRRQPHPLAHQLVRLCGAMTVTLVLLTAMVAALNPRLHGQAAFIGLAVWVIVLSAMLLMLPFLSRTQRLMREFSLLAGVSTVATALDLLFVAVFSLGNFASLALALFIALALYAGARQWLLSQFVSRQRLTTERMFERVYRMAREVQLRPADVGEQWISLLRDLFEPLDAQPVARRVRNSRVVSEGASLVVPMPLLGPAPHDAIVLGLADRGRRLFTDDDARLADRMVDLVTRVVTFDQAVERARSEERVRIAQDLHDDIGARLLTLMYKAPTPEMEDYLRHTLKDLKTLTRGLAAPSHLLSHAVAEWKSDIAQRLAAADCELGWSFAYDRDFELSVVQWSALTRVLRELVSNALAHANASRVDVEASLHDGTLSLSVSDNGSGRRPETWSHGLGLGGVRKRVKQMGGSVAWSENGQRGIVCRVTVPDFGRAGGP
jgi:signal transduction histidine kinase